MATQVNNTASIAYQNGRTGQDTANSNVATTLILEQYALSGTKNSLNSSFAPGENITYQISATNEGTDNLYNVTLADNLGGGSPAYLNYVPGSATLTYNGTTTLITPTSTNPLAFVLPTSLASGETGLITYLATVSSALPTTVNNLTNTVLISANSGSTTGPVITVSPSPTETLPRGNYALLNVTKNVSAAQIQTGEEFSYTLVLNNTGNIDANNVVVTDVLPAGFVISSITSLTNGTTTTFTTSDYTVDSATNTLTLPSTTSALSINVPAAVAGVPGTTVVTITGSIS